MKISAICSFNGKPYTMDFPNMTESQFLISKKMWDDGMLIQEAFPFLTAEEREFLMTGTPPHVWDEMFAEVES